MRGRKPVPTHLKMIKGNPGKRRARQPPEPARTDAPPSPPPHLKGRAAEAWIELAPELWRLGLLSSVDHAVFAVYCTAYARWLDAEEQLAQLDEMTIKTEHGMKQHPLLLISRQAAETMRRSGELFGLSPLSRLRLTGIEAPRAPSKFDGLIG